MYLYGFVTPKGGFMLFWNKRTALNAAKPYSAKVYKKLDCPEIWSWDYPTFFINAQLVEN
jgi:hypothetical protein